MKSILFIVFQVMFLGSAFAIDANLEAVLNVWDEVEFSDECCQKSQQIIDFSGVDGATSVGAIQLVFPDEKEMLAPVEFIIPDEDTVFDFLFANVLVGDVTLEQITKSGSSSTERQLKKSLAQVLDVNNSAYPDQVYKVLNFNGGGKYYKTSALALIDLRTQVGVVIYVQGSKD